METEKRLRYKMASYDAGSRRHAVIEEGRGENIECWGFKYSLPRTVVVYTAGFFTCGVLFLIIFYWRPHWGLRLTHFPCALECADGLIVKDMYERRHRCNLVRQRVTKDADQSEDSGISAGVLKTVMRIDFPFADESLLYFRFQKSKYLWDSEQQQFTKLRGLGHGVLCSQLYDKYSHGLDEEDMIERQKLYGLNEIRVRVRPILVLLLKEVMNPFYFFQLCTVIFWFAIDYIYYTVCIVVMSAVSISVSLYTTHTESTRLRKLTDVDETVDVLRKDGKRVTLPCEALVPGDVIIIPSNGCHLTCDVAVLAGNCIVNESMLTGESVPVTKTPLPNPQGRELEYSLDVHKKHTIFCGTEVIQVRAHGDEVVKCVVVQTGFSTAKGQLVKSILYPKPAEIKLYRDALLFVGILALLAFLGMIYTATMMTVHGAGVKTTVIHVLDIVAIAVPPALPAVLTIGMVYAQFRLKKQSIYCISPQRINLCGAIDVVCLDKTGTLTEDGLDMMGVQPASNGRFDSFVKDARALCHNLVSVAMATCHELIEVKGELTGDPLDIKMFAATGWTLNLGKNQKNSMSGALATAKMGKRISSDKSRETEAREALITEATTLKIFPFASAHQTMSVIVCNVTTNDTFAFVKGSPEKIQQLSKNETIPADFQKVLDSYTKKGLRLIALAWKPIDVNVDDAAQITGIQREAVECDLEFLGLLVMQNRLKGATTQAIAELNAANIRSIMVTGDNMYTAVSVARECGMVPPQAPVIRVEATPPSEHTKARLVITPLLDSVEPGWVAAENHIQENGDKQVDNILIAQDEEHNLLTVDGATFAIIRTHYPQMLAKITAQGVIFARMSPDQKSQLVESLQSLGLSVAMCGDGANDCGALKQAHVGVALSQAEASVAAPFTSKTATISCIPTVLKEGRCAMVTSFSLFKYMALYSLIMFTSVIVLTSAEVYIGDMQFFVFDIVLSTLFVLTVGGNKAYHELSTCRPHTKLVTPPIVFAVIVQTVLQLAFQVGVMLLVRRQPWYTSPEIDKDVRNVESYENTAVFVFSNFQYLIMAFVYIPRPPYSNIFYKNIALMIVLVLDLFVCFGFLFAPPANIVRVFKMVVIPSYAFKGILLALAATHLVLACLVEYVLASSKSLMNLVTCRCCRKRQPAKYQGVELTTLRRPLMELMTDAETVEL